MNNLKLSGMKSNAMNSIIKCLIIGIISLIISCQGKTRENIQSEETQDNTYDALHYDVVSASYISNTLSGIKRNLKICLPSDYDTITHKLPALYLFHGSEGNELSWFEKSNMLLRLNQEYKAGRMVPMVIVLPSCEPEGSNYMGVGPEGDLFVKEIVEDIIPFVENNYKVSSLREDRAVGGCSAGGIQTLNLALFFPEMFGYVYPMGAFFSPNAITVLSSGEYDDVLRNPEINTIKVFFITMGLQDARYELCQKTLKLLDDYNIKYDYWESEGGHDWQFWILNFEYMLVELFRK